MLQNPDQVRRIVAIVALVLAVASYFVSGPLLIIAVVLVSIALLL